MRITRDCRTILWEPPDDLRKKIKEALSYPNPQYQAAVHFGRTNPRYIRIPKMIEECDEIVGGLSIPNGIDLARFGIDKGTVEDRRVDVTAKWPFMHVELFPSQVEAMHRAKAGKYHGIVVLPSGEGKTIAGLAIAWESSQRTLVLVHRKSILDAWIKDFYRIFSRCEELRVWEGSRSIREGPGSFLTVGMVQTLYHQEKWGSMVNAFGLVICDECQHAPADMVKRVVETFHARRRIGLTATPARKDGRQRTMFAVFGPRLLMVDEKQARNTMSYKVMAKDTGRPRMPEGDGTEENPVNHGCVVDSLIRDEERNENLLRTISSLWTCGRRIVAFTARVAHARHIAARLNARNIPAIALTGASAKALSKRAYAAALLRRTVIVTTFALNQEGTNFPAWDCGILMTTSNDKNGVRQMVGRIRRTYPGKREPLWIDFVDTQTPYLRRHFDNTRKEAYRTARRIEYVGVSQ